MHMSQHSTRPSRVRLITPFMPLTLLALASACGGSQPAPPPPAAEATPASADGPHPRSEQESERRPPQLVFLHEGAFHA